MEKETNNLKKISQHIKEEGLPSTEAMRSQLEEKTEAGIQQDIESKVIEYKTLFNKFYAGTASNEEISRMTDLSEELNRIIKKEINHKKKNEIIKSQIDSLEENIEVIDEKIEPLAETWRDFDRQLYTLESGHLFLSKPAIEERKRLIKKLKEERDYDSRIIEMRSLEEKKREMQGEISKLQREWYENSLNELKSEISGLSEEAYKELDSLTKEHIEPLQEYGMTEKAAKEKLEPRVSSQIYDLEAKINIYERIQDDIKRFLEDKEHRHDIERLKNQLKETERFSIKWKTSLE